jgi:3-deoxy-manno-octulosonate cytidylyltransferase (CMP-KDO synthetase)
MIWWVYQQALKVQQLDALVVAIDDQRVQTVCEELGIRTLMTRQDHHRHIGRIHEVSETIPADYYLVICGDEPLISPGTIELLLPKEAGSGNEPSVCSLMREIRDPSEANDPSNIKVATSIRGNCLFMTRTPVPFPYKKTSYSYKKLVGIERFNKAALDFFVSTSLSPYEEIEDITLMRFIENDIPVKLKLTDAYQLEVDTYNDLEQVRSIIQLQHESRES